MILLHSAVVAISDLYISQPQIYAENQLEQIIYSIVSTSSIIVPDLIDLSRQSRAALSSHVQRYWLGVSPNIK